MTTHRYLFDEHADGAPVKDRVLRQLMTGWNTAAMVAHYAGCSKSAAQQAIRALRQERSDVRKRSVKGSGYYCIARIEQPDLLDKPQQIGYDGCS